LTRLLQYPILHSMINQYPARTNFNVATHQGLMIYFSIINAMDAHELANLIYSLGDVKDMSVWTPADQFYYFEL
jgi:hypothetical protein